MNTFSITDTGRIRTSNQDYVFCEENAVGSFPNLFIVADGMGGHKAGDTASRMCVEEVARQIQNAEHRTPVSMLIQAVEAANKAVYEHSLTSDELTGMGTTVVGTTIVGDTAYVINVGDSRLYQMREELKQVTVDHSLVEEMVKSGEILKDEMRTHPNKNIITRALGTDTVVRPDCFEIEVKQGDVILLCSDGLTNMIEDYEIEKILKDNIENLEQAGKKLVDVANQNGGKDNISVVLVRL